MTPPPAGRKARKGYISKDDFAELVGVTRSRMYAWTRAERPEHPEPQYRERLAALSDGLYQPQDFARAGEAERQDRLVKLAEEVERLTAALDASGRAHDRLRARVVALERQAGLRPNRERQAELATREGPTRQGRAAR